MISALVLTLSIIASRPAANSSGSIMTVREAVASRKTRPDIKMQYWQADGSLDSKRPTENEWILPLPDKSYGTVVSRNEFGCSKGIFPSEDESLFAVYHKDESKVTDFPLLDINSRTGKLKSTKYPMAGMTSERLELCVADASGKILTTLDINDFDEERYLTGVSWSPDSKYIFVQVLDREQHNMRLNMYRSSDGKFVRTILTEHNDAWVEPLDPIYFIKGSYKFIYRSDNRDNFRNLYVCDTLGHVNRLTKTDADVSYLTNDGKWVYYTSAEVSPIENHLFRINVKSGKKQRLSSAEGWHEIFFNSDASKYLDLFSSLNNPGTLELRQADGKLLQTLSQAGNPLEEYAQCEVQLGSVKAADGITDNYYRLIKPLNFDPSKKYPLILYVYGGPHSQMVKNSWLAEIRMWEMLMAQKGYVLYIQDNRGTSNRGAAFEKAINRHCGQVEMQDQMAGFNELMKEPWIDKDRIGVHGWSYGGFMCISLMTSYPNIFKAGIAGGPVIDWKWYEVMYGERYMDTPQTNPDGFAQTSLMGKAQNLKGKLLICQGMLDGTVLPQHSMSFTQECIEKGIPLEYFPYPRDEHNMRGKARVHLYEKITDYFLTNL